ncbi:hypothetical protein YC2023_122994 [Brassica napus]
MNAAGTGVASAEFSYGAGHVDPIAALNPGLVYELDKADYIAFLCGMNFNMTTLKIIAGEAVTCTENILQRNLNYPSMSAKLSSSDSSFTVTFNRTVTNVGAPNSTYKCKVLAGRGSTLSVKVFPSVLSMKSVNEKQSFTVTVSGSNVDPELPSSASLIWFDGTHNLFHCSSNTEQITHITTSLNQLLFIVQTIYSLFLDTHKNKIFTDCRHSSSELLDSIKFEALGDDTRNHSRPQRTPGQHIEIDIMHDFIFL